MFGVDFDDLIDYDKDVSKRIHSYFQGETWCPKISYYLAKLLTLSADGIVWFPLPALAFLILGKADRTLLGEQSMFRDFFILYLGCVLCAAVELTLKPIFGRRRPLLPTNETQRFIKAEHYSFPSGHTMRAFYIASYITILNWQWGLGTLIWAVFVGISRVVILPNDAGYQRALSADGFGTALDHH